MIYNFFFFSFFSFFVLFSFNAILFRSTHLVVSIYTALILTAVLC